MSVITAVDHIIAKWRHIHNSDLISSTHIMTINKFFLNLFEVEIEHPENWRWWGGSRGERQVEKAKKRENAKQIEPEGSLLVERSWLQINSNQINKHTTRITILS